jgi:hypothetical protein
MDVASPELFFEGGIRTTIASLLLDGFKVWNFTGLTVTVGGPCYLSGELLRFALELL